MQFGAVLDFIGTYKLYVITCNFLSESIGILRWCVIFVINVRTAPVYDQRRPLIIGSTDSDISGGDLQIGSDHNRSSGRDVLLRPDAMAIPGRLCWSSGLLNRVSGHHTLAVSTQADQCVLGKS